MRSSASRLLAGRSCQQLFSTAKDVPKDAGAGAAASVKPGGVAGAAAKPAAAGTSSTATTAGPAPGLRQPGTTGPAAGGRPPAPGTAATRPGATTGPTLTAPGPTAASNAVGSSPIGSSSVGSSSVAGASGAAGGGSSRGGGSGGRKLLVPVLMLAAPLGAYWVYDQYLNGLFGPGPVIGGGGKVFDSSMFGGKGKGSGKGPGGSGGSGGVAAGGLQSDDASADGDREAFTMRTLAPGEEEQEQDQLHMDTPAASDKASGSSKQDTVGPSNGQATQGSQAGVHNYSPAADEFPGAVPVDAAPLMDLLNEALSGSSSAGVGAAGGAEEARHEQSVEQATADQSVSAVKAAQAAAGATTSDTTSAAHADSSDASSSQAAQQQQADSTTAAPQAPASSSTAAPAAPARAGALPPPGSLPAPSATGFKQDLTPGGLVSRAMEGGFGAEGDWGSYGAQLRQATSDAAAFREALEQVRNNYQARLDDANASAEQASAALQEARKQAESLSQRYQQLMKEQARLAQEVTKAEVRRAEERVLAATAEHAVTERKERLKALDDVRMQLNTLSKAFQHRSDQARSSTEIHRISLRILALEHALETGQPFERQLQALRASCVDDPLLQAALDALPAQVARQGLPTAQQLEQQFANVKQQANELSYFPVGSGGMVAHLVAKLAAKLKVDEAPPAGPLTPAAAAGAPLAAAQAALASGKLLEAASAVEAATAGTAAQQVSAAWVDAARKRALTEQTVQLLRAHAAATASSVA